MSIRNIIKSKRKEVFLYTIVVFTLIIVAETLVLLYGNLQEESRVFPFIHRIDECKYIVYDYVLKELINNRNNSNKYVLVIRGLDGWFQTLYENTIVFCPYPHAAHWISADDPKLPLFKNLTQCILSANIDQLYEKYNVSMIVISAPYGSQWYPDFIYSFLKDFLISLQQMQLSKIRIIQFVSLNSGDAIRLEIHDNDLQVLSRSYRLHLIKGFQNDEYVHILWFPLGSKVLFRKWQVGTLGDPINEYVIDSSNIKVSLLSGQYLIEAVIPILHTYVDEKSLYIVELIIFNFPRSYNNESLTTYVLLIKPKNNE